MTIAIPFYSGRAYFFRALQSAIQQTHRNIEIVISDNCSPELKPSDIEPYLKDPRIRYIRHEKNLGMIGNWNFCIDSATTDLVSILHGDDELSPTYAEHICETATNYPDTTLFYCQAVIINNKSQPSFSFPDFIKKCLTPSRSSLHEVHGETGAASLLTGCYIFCPSVCYRKSKLGRERFLQQWKQVPDLEMWLRLLIKNHSFIGLPYHDYLYRRHQENATAQNTVNSLRFVEELKMHFYLADEAEKLSWSKAATIGRRCYILRFNILYCAIKDAAAFNLMGSLQKLRLVFATSASFANEA